MLQKIKEIFSPDEKILEVDSEYSDRLVLNVGEDEKKGYVIRNRTQISDNLVIEDLTNVCFSRNNLAFPNIKISS